MIKEVLVSPKGKLSYPVIISHAIDFLILTPYIKNKEVLIVTNTIIAKQYLPLLESVISSGCYKLEHCILEDGESHKNQVSLNIIYQKLLAHHYTRSCVLIALGGGVVGDITGFAAATYQRGVTVIQIPTTLLSQVDSSVGGKTAINHPLGKNMIGAFFQPQLVYTSTAFLTSLPEREFSAGMAEIVKYGCIVDADFFVWLERNVTQLNAHEQATLTYAIAKSCELKAKLVALDEEERTGVRALLNFGHTFGHAIECCQNYTGLKHGEAVAIGMIMATQLSYQLGYVDQGELKRIMALISAFSLPIVFPEGLNKNDFIAAMLRDKKNTTQGVTLILLDKIGQTKLDKTISQGQLELFLQQYF